MEYQKIILPTHPHTDTLVGIFLLKEFGNKKYPGINKAKIEVWNSLPEKESSESLFQKGYFLIDIGEGRFDHHFRGKTVSQMIAEDLEIAGVPALNKILTYAERDDKYGLGTISSDPIDKAFGLSGLITALNKIFDQDPNRVAEIILPIVDAHYREEKRRTEELPQEFEKMLKEGKAEIFILKQQKKKLNVVIIESSNPSIVGWLRSSAGQKADVVVQQMPSGHVNILTRPLKRVDLRLVVILLRKEEMISHNRQMEMSFSDLVSFGRVPGIPEWYYDRATNSFQNGGINPKGTPSTAIPFKTVKERVKEGLSQSFTFQERIPSRRFSEPLSKIQENQYFLEVRVPLESAQKIREMVESPPAGIKLHLPQNYHCTLMHFGEYRSEELDYLFGKIQSVLEKTKPFSIEINSKNLEAGEIVGYQNKAFSFLIPDNQGGKEMKEIRSSLEESIARFLSQEFSPHLTIAAVIPGIEEKITEETGLDFKKEFQIKFLVEKIRLTEVIKKASGQTVYKTKKVFILG